MSFNAECSTSIFENWTNLYCYFWIVLFTAFTIKSNLFSIWDTIIFVKLLIILPYNSISIFQLRRHPNPREADLLELQKLALNKGFLLDIQSNKELALSLEKATDKNDPAINQVSLFYTALD